MHAAAWRHVPTGEVEPHGDRCEGLRAPGSTCAEGRDRPAAPKSAALSQVLVALDLSADSTSGTSAWSLRGGLPG